MGVRHLSLVDMLRLIRESVPLEGPSSLLLSRRLRDSVRAGSCRSFEIDVKDHSEQLLWKRIQQH